MRAHAYNHFISYNFIDTTSKILYDKKIEWYSIPNAMRVWVLAYSEDKGLYDIITAAVYNDSGKTLKQLNKYVLTTKYLEKLNHYLEKKALIGELKIEALAIVGMVPLKINPSELYKKAEYYVEID